MTNVLFICTANRERSPTAEQVFADWPGVETDSAGIANDAEVQLSTEQVEWADTIFVMEKVHRTRLQKRFRKYLNGKKVICLDIPDFYPLMDMELVELLKARVRPYLRQANT
ncbi:low molecular weight protein tyrosine phosphatase family protein [Hyphobacterium marinum]|uniref:Low molecular weight protein tyrosine phosphatase family protein n=1 Tax=Hyphobacterium marinum TaxID=3116574 RepID=A0ABU7LXY2_9PROT|nr:low molecular weight protein tyrosine phosphatase family protein [Hyphobacterium sp. Y6023]MEE2566050.1 low molecular weight protein tyrosine phosphatase family protein [Hyphobacterium sp. Y6023]